MKRTGLFGLILVSALSLPLVSVATAQQAPCPCQMGGQGMRQGGPGMRQGGPGKGMMMSSEQRMQVLKSEVGLDDATAKKVDKIFQENQKERQELMEEMRDYRQTIRKLLDSDSNDQAAYQKALDGIRETQAELHNLRIKQQDGVRALLTPKQQARLGKAMHQQMKGMRGGRGPQGGPPMMDEE